MKRCVIAFLLLGAWGTLAADERPRVGVFDEAVPGQNPAATVQLKAEIARRGYAVTALDGEAFRTLSEKGLAAIVVPSCEAVPWYVAEGALSFVQAGGVGIFLGGPLLDQRVVRRLGKWHVHQKIPAEYLEQPLGFRPPVLGTDFDARRWTRSQARGGTNAFVRAAGNELELSVGPLNGWDVMHTPRGARFFGTDETLFSFEARAAEPETTLAVEMIEKDASRWIATVTVGTNWERQVLAPNDFRYWHDSGSKGRGGKGDLFRPSAAHELGLGISYSHTPSMGGRAAHVWFRNMASCRNPLAGVALEEVTRALPEQDGVYPRYKLLVRDGAARAIFRPVGEGFGRGVFERFIPLTGEQGVAAAWMLLERRPQQPLRRLAGFGQKDWSRPETLAQIGVALDRLTRGDLLFEAGSDRFAAFPGEAVTLGAAWRGGAKRAVLVVRDAHGAVVYRADVANGQSIAWQPPKTPSAYRIEATLGEDRIAHDFAVVADTPDPPEDFIRVVGGDFILRGKPWYPVGINFWPLYVAGMSTRDYWAGWMRNEYYAPSLVEWDLAHFAAMGGNMISIQAPALGHERNLLDVLRRCRRHGIRVNLFVQQASPLDTKYVPSAVPGAERPSALEEYLTATRLAGNATVFAYDTIWEPGNHVFRDDRARGRWDGAWRAWIDENYGGVAQAERAWGFAARRNAKGEVIGPEQRWFTEDGAWRGLLAAYRRFMDNMTSRAWNKATRALRALAPNQLISFRQGNTLPYDFALTGPVRHIDFICPEGYAVPNTAAGEDAIGWITRYVDATTGGKPIVWSEFGQSVWNPVRMESDARVMEVQGSYQERFYRTGLAAGANGTAPWWWTGGYRVGERSDYGIVGPDGAERPAAKLLRRYASRFRAARAKPTPGAWMTFDRDAHAGGYCRAAFHEGAAAWHAAAAQGKVLGVRLAGTDQVAETAEPRFLDAEFDCCDVVRDGETVSVRAVLGNVGMATWTAQGVQLAARDAQGRLLARQAIGTTVPRLAATERLALTFKAKGTVKVRLEVKDRLGFGETRQLHE